MIKLAVLASGNGSNFQAIVDAIESKRLKAEVVKLISDNPLSYALKRAAKHQIPNALYDRKKFKDQSTFEKAILEDLKNSQAEWVALAGFMRILSPLFLKAFPQRILNIHPSLLPAFPGLNAIEQAFHSGVKVMGCSVHLVDEGCDTGPLLAQKSFELRSDDNLESVTQRMHLMEHELYLEVLQRIEEGKIKIDEKKIILG